MLRTRLIILLPFAVLFAAPSLAQDIEELHQQDERLANVSSQLFQPNAVFCDRLMPDFGLVLHSRDQYGSTYSGQFSDSTLAISAVAPGSAAAIAGFRAGDQILAIGETDIVALQPDGARPARDIAFDILADQLVDKPVAITVERGGSAQSFDLAAPASCRLLVEITTESGYSARTDGKVMQVSYSLADAVTDDQLAAILAHELGHVVLRHRQRLDAAGIEGGLFKEVGRNRSVARATEIAADRISVHLLANAGFDPYAAIDFWQTPASQRVSGGIFRSGIYPSVSARIAILADEIERYLPFGAAPDHPGHLLDSRDLPL